MSGESWAHVVERDPSGNVIDSYEVRTPGRPTASTTAPDDAGDWVADLERRLYDCPEALFVVGNEERQQVESRWSHHVFLVAPTAGGFRLFHRSDTGIGWEYTYREVFTTIDELLPKMQFANNLAAELAKSKPTPAKAVPYWEHRATRLTRYLLSQARDATERLHRDLGEADDETEGVDLEDVAAQAAAIADTLRVLAAV